MPLFDWERVPRSDPVYQACLATTVGAFAIVGGAAGGPLLLPGILGGYAAGAAWGFATGFLACPYLVPAIKRKIETGEAFNLNDVRSAAETMSTYADVNKARDALMLLATVRRIRRPAGGEVCSNPAVVAREILHGLRQPVNSQCFSQPHWLAIAEGRKIEDWLGDPQTPGNGGIERPQEVHLRTGLRYYRFTSSNSDVAVQWGSGWWMEFESLKTVERFAQNHGYSLSEAARLFFAIPYRMSRVDRLVSGMLAVPLKAYTGLGRPVDVKTSDKTVERWIPNHYNRVVQLYIPGLSGIPETPLGIPGQALYQFAFEDRREEFIAGNRSLV